MKKRKKSNKILHTKTKEEIIINLKKELVLMNIKRKTKQDIKPHVIKQIKNKISRILTLGETII
uniref:50S ribosomal protein L29 n=1 Tax=Laurencia verruciformis TaxID=3073068 RepID=A0AA51NFF6_9FLOR|nr:50S ribosomal protein L29 [Laurencia obtusa]WMP12310.1 50S ribosomal protein L29 [Laurencia verruciformis]WMP12954.1 50S ribosomal protein L29 [Laurencia obtusa]